MRAIVTCALLLASASAEAADHPTFNIITENDSYISISGDRHYTNGIYFSWTSASRQEAGSFAQYLLPPGAGQAEWRTGYFLGQAIFTPENLAAFTPPSTDRPYAGWLFGGARLYRDDGDTLDKIEATAGVSAPPRWAAMCKNSGMPPLSQAPPIPTAGMTSCGTNPDWS